MTAPLHLALMQPADEPEYTRFLTTCPGATFYHSLPYRDLLVAMLAPSVDYMIVRRGGSIVATLPVMAKAGPAGEIVNSLPFFGSHGDILARDAEAREELTRWFHGRIARNGVAAATIVANPFDPASVPGWADSTASDERIAQWTPLPEGPEAYRSLLDTIDGSARRNIRKAEAAGVTVRQDATAFAFLETVHRQNMAEIGGKPKPASFFAEVPRVMAAGRDYRLYVAEHSGEAIAALLLFYFGPFVEYITPVTRPGSRDLQPTAAILSRAMTDAIADGRRIWNWGGTWLTQDGVYRFKRKWGARETRYRYATFVRNPELLHMTPEALGKHYPYFYAFPFTLYGAQPSRDEGCADNGSSCA